MSLFSSKLDLKPVFQFLFGAIVIGAVLALIFSFSIDKMVESSLESTTSKALNTSVDVHEVSLSLLDGSGTINGITIHNPEGFSENPALKFQQISIKVKITSLFSDTVIVDRVQVKTPELYFEQQVEGNNFDALTNNMSNASSSEGSLIVDFLLIKKGQITLATDIGGEKSVVAEFSSIELENIGRSGNNAMEQTIQQILTPVLEKALKEAATQGLMDKAKEAMQDLLEE